ncbi:MAG: class I SAM-dependent methyltransferase [Deltaproteobacteria bacterium]|nr:class I SAM-dependent methyltransferase [Deltaproteobacteria bacterium]
MIDRLAERAVRRTFERCDVHIGGDRPWDIQVHDNAWYRRMALNPALHLGEGYLDGLWDCDAIDELHHKLLTSEVGRLQYGVKHLWRTLRARLRNPQSRSRAVEVAEHHYDVGAELFSRMLDQETMSYTCAFWNTGDSLSRAQVNKLEMICDKLELREGERLLDVGCGFGGLAEYAARTRGARVVGITNSKLHQETAAKRCAGLPVEILLLDYRDLPALGRTFDKVASIEMIEAVGPRNFATYMNAVHSVLRSGARFVIQSFLSEGSLQVCNEWFDRHIFPNGVTPSLEQLAGATQGNFGEPLRVQKMGPHYPPTLMAWSDNLHAWFKDEPHAASERERRKWRFYLHGLAGVFRAGDLDLCQLEYRRP